MSTNNDWMPTRLADLAVMFANVLAKIAGYGPTLPLTAAQVAEIEKLCNEFEGVYSYVVQSKATTESLTEWRDLVLKGGPMGDPMPAPPTYPAFISGLNWIIGVLPRFRELVELIKASDGYTKAIGEDLMIVRVSPNSIVPSEVTPSIKLFPAAHDYHFSIVVENRGDAKMWDLYITRKGGSPTKHGTYEGKAADIFVTPTTPGDAEQIQCYIQLRAKNENYGQPSPSVFVTLNP